MPIHGRHKVQLTYFKQSGKYYEESEFLSRREDVNKIFEDVKSLQAGGALPGLSPGCGKDFYIMVNPVELPQGYPALIKPVGVEDE